MAVIGGTCAASPNYPTFACLKALNALAVVVSVNCLLYITWVSVIPIFSIKWKTCNRLFNKENHVEISTELETKSME